MKRFLIVCLVLFCAGCAGKGSGVVEKNGLSKTYNFFKDFDSNKYYVCFFDRNSSKNDDTKIIMARDGGKYYYSIEGEIHSSIIQKDGVKYTLNYNTSTYFKEDSDVHDYSIGILPSNINRLKKMSYKTGRSKVFNLTYVFEKFVNDNGETTYYFKGSKLIYVKYKNVYREILLRFNYMNKKVSSKLFDVGDLTEVTY